MSLGPMFKGQTPSEPALITVTAPDGTPRDLALFTADGHLYAPDGTDVSAGSYTQVADAPNGLVQFDWPIPSAFDDAGIYLLQIELTTADPDVLDFTTVVEIEVLPDAPPDAQDLRVTTAQVERNTGKAVSTADIATAQALVSLFVARNLSDPLVWDAILDQDRYWLSLAISHQAAWARTHIPDDSVPVGAVSVTAGDVSINYGAGGASTEDMLLAPLAKMSLKRVRWVGNRTIHATPLLGMGRNPLRPLWEVTVRS